MALSRFAATSTAEIYQGPEGCQAHMALGQAREKMFGVLLT